MREIQERNEVMLNIANDLGVLAKLFAVLAVQSPGVDAWRFYSDHQRAAVLLIADKNSRIIDLLRAAGFECEANQVVVVEEKHRSLSAVRLSTELRANGVEMLDAYTCCSPRNGTVLVLKTTDNSRAVTVLEAMNLLEAQQFNPDPFPHSPVLEAMNLLEAQPLDSRLELLAAGEVSQQPATGMIG